MYFTHMDGFDGAVGRQPHHSGTGDVVDEDATTTEHALHQALRLGVTLDFRRAGQEAVLADLPRIAGPHLEAEDVAHERRREGHETWASVGSFRNLRVGEELLEAEVERAVHLHAARHAHHRPSARLHRLARLELEL